jgi:phosphoenolpyruvate synthase/pyruvate phosphate dikinase
MLKIDPKNYKPLFKWEGEASCFSSNIFLSGSLGVGNPIAVYKDKRWRTFIDKEKEKICLRRGVALFSDKNKYKHYAKSFRNFLRFVKKDIIPKYRKVPKTLSKREFLDLVELPKKFFYFYGFTEFSYTDLAYQKLQKRKNAILKKNLDDVSKNLKFEGRPFLDEFVSIYIVLAKYFNRKYFNGKNTAGFMYLDELADLFDNKKISRRIIEQRKKCYAVAKINGKFIKFPYKKSLELAKSFIKKLEISKEIRGTVANPGKARGRVVIVQITVYDPVKIRKTMAKMKKGDILVTETTVPYLLPLCQKAGAIVANQGGMLSHAAIVSRELNIPCVIGTNDASYILKDGDLVEVDADKGIVKIIK